MGLIPLLQQVSRILARALGSSRNMRRLLREIRVFLEKFSQETGRGSVQLTDADLDRLAGRLADHLNRVNRMHSAYRFVREFFRR